MFLLVVNLNSLLSNMTVNLSRYQPAVCLSSGLVQTFRSWNAFWILPSLQISCLFNNNNNKGPLLLFFYCDLIFSILTKPVTHYLVKWCSLPYEDSTWELKQDIDQAKIEEFEKLMSREPEMERVVRIGCM